MERPAPIMTAHRTVFQASVRSSVFLTATPTAQLLKEVRAFALNKHVALKGWIFEHTS